MANEYVDRSSDFADAIVTGGTGFIGRWLLAELTARGRRVLVPIRNAAAREAELRAFVDSHGGRAELLEIVDGDLDASGLGLSDRARDRAKTASLLFHLGAAFAWKLEEAHVARTNVGGTERVLDLAAELPNLDRFVTIGGYRLAERIDRRGRRYRPETRHFEGAGAYEGSKHAAHVACVTKARALGVPLSVLHVSSVIGDSRTGETTQWHGIVASIVALARGKLPARAFGKDTFVPLVTVDFVAKVLVAMADDASLVGEELTLFDPESPNLDAVIDRAAAALGVAPPALRIPTWLARSLPERMTRTPREAFSFLDDVRYPIEATETWLAKRGLVHPPFDEAFDRWVRFAAANAPRGA